VESGSGRFDGVAKRLVDVVGAATLLILSLPLIVVVVVLIKIDSRGPVFFRCVRVGYRGQEFGMLKFRKMKDHATGAALTAAGDPRLTRVGRILARSKIDEIPQLWNVLKGEMSLVGPRPEHPSFVQLRADEYSEILRVRPGMTGLTQLAFAKETEILDPESPVADYVERLLPQKISLDRLYAHRRSIAMDVRALFWTGVAVGLRHDVAVNRGTGSLGLRRRPQEDRVVVADVAKQLEAEA